MLPGGSRDEEELENWLSEWSGDPRRLQSIDRGARLSGEGATVLDPLKRVWFWALRLLESDKS